ncbi:MAG: hypothetical protein IPO63_14600 [Bacteroidetes bacterium]|nr:hypothetical protein [Bacteroidota bacterium]
MPLYKKLNTTESGVVAPAKVVAVIVMPNQFELQSRLVFFRQMDHRQNTKEQSGQLDQVLRGLQTIKESSITT